MIRIATIEDLPGIVAIYNEAIAAGFQTAFTEPLRLEERVAWFNDHPADQYPLLVYEESGMVAGWLSVSAYRPGREALRTAAEVSYFIRKDCQGRGIGIGLLGHGIELSKAIGLRTLLAIILEPNVVSAGLLRKFGFEEWGYLPDIADFDGRICSQVYYGLKLGS